MEPFSASACRTEVDRWFFSELFVAQIALIQKAKYGPVPEGVLRPANAVKTVFPKKKGSPKSKLFEFGPPTSLKTKTPEVWNKVLALATLNVIVRADPEGVPDEPSPITFTEMGVTEAGQ